MHVNATKWDVVVLEVTIFTLRKMHLLLNCTCKVYCEQILLENMMKV